MQLLCVALILPHESAVVTNTCSKRKEGFSYGFLEAGVRGLSEGLSFIAIMRNLSLSLLSCFLNFLSYCNADCDACVAQPPVPPDVEQVWFPWVEK